MLNFVFFVYINYFGLLFPSNFIIFMPAQTLLFQGFIHRFLHFILSENFIFFLCRKTSADMTFLFIVLQNLFHLFPQLRIHLLQTLGNVFMYCCTKLVRYHPSPFLWQDVGKFVFLLLCLPRSFQLYVSILHLSYFGLM